MSENCIAWDDAFSVNFELIDNQHKELVRMTNMLFEGCKMGSTAADVVFMKTIRNAVEYAQTHFYTEEKYMKQSNFPELDAHVAEHNKFVSTVVQAVKDFEESNSDPLALANFLKQWLLDHIAKSDKKYEPYIAALNDLSSTPLASVNRRQVMLFLKASPESFVVPEQPGSNKARISTEIIPEKLFFIICSPNVK